MKSFSLIRNALTTAGRVARATLNLLCKIMFIVAMALFIYLVLNK